MLPRDAKYINIADYLARPNVRLRETPAELEGERAERARQDAIAIGCFLLLFFGILILVCL